MQSYTGILRKMRTELDSPVRYYLRLDEQEIPITQWVGQSIRLNYLGVIRCVYCDRETKKSFNQGFCYPCFRKLAQCDICIIKPEKCHYAEGTCREPEWAQEHCMRKHFVYFANTTGLKVGITRDTQLPTRWIDQGAVEALPIIAANSRHVAGLVEVAVAQHVKDKTSWQAMLKGRAIDVDLLEAKQYWQVALETTVNPQNFQWLDDQKPTQIEYPVLTYPSKVTSLDFNKHNEIRGTLQGIKGQYLLLDVGVLNIRKFGGYSVTVSL